MKRTGEPRPPEWALLRTRSWDILWELSWGAPEGVTTGEINNIVGTLVGALVGAFVGALLGPLVGTLVEPLMESNFALSPALCADESRTGTAPTVPHRKTVNDQRLESNPI